MLKLALKGGKPVAKDVKVPQWPLYDEKDKKSNFGNSGEQEGFRQKKDMEFLYIANLLSKRRT